MRDKATHMLGLRSSRPKPPNGIGAALALDLRNAAPAGAPCCQASSQANPRGLRTKKPLRPSIARFAVAVAVVAAATPAFAAGKIDEVLRETHWGESSGELFRQFGTNAIRLPRALDFGDSYADVVLRGQTLGAVPMVVFFQMDKVTHGLKRIQLERPRHGVNPPAFRAIAAALHDVNEALIRGLARPRARHDVPLHVFDWQQKHETAGLARNALYLLRPDTYVALADPSGAPDALERYCAEHEIHTLSASR